MEMTKEGSKRTLAGHRATVSAADIRDELSGSLVSRTSRVFELVKSAVFLSITVITLHSLLITLSIVDGPSMQPTYHTGDVVLVDRRDWTRPEAGAVVILKYPGDPDRHQYIKRVVAVPGDRVVVRAGRVVVNGRTLSEPYLPAGLSTQPDTTEWTLGPTEYYTLGDNRPVSNDSRFFGPVDRRFIIGSVVATIYTAQPAGS